MIVDNTGEGIIALPELANVKDKSGEIINEIFRSKLLMSGINEIDDNYWNELKKNNLTIKSLLEYKVLIEIPTKNKKAMDLKIDEEKLKLLKKDLKTSTGKEKENIENEIKKIEKELENQISFQNYTLSEKEDIINSCYDIELLKKWKTEDETGHIRNIILDRIDSLEKNIDLKVKVKK